MRKLLVVGVAVVVGLLVAGWLVFSWFEAEQEVRILCSEFHVGLEHEHVFHILDTGSFLRYRAEPGDGAAGSVGVGGTAANNSTITVDSLYNLGIYRCVIEFEDGRVVSSTYE